MFAVLFAFIFVTAYAADELPSYFHVCVRNDPNYGQCIVDNINSARSMVCQKGLPEFDVAPIEPIVIDRINIYDTDNLKLNIQDSKVTGFCNWEITSHQIDAEKLHFVIEFTLKHLDMDSTYDFDIRVLMPLANKGLIHISTDNLTGKLILDSKEVTKNGETQIYASKINTNLDIKSFKYEFDNSEKNLVQLHEALTSTIRENEKDIISKVKPQLEETTSKIIMSLFNKVAINRAAQLFPKE